MGQVRASAKKRNLFSRRVSRKRVGEVSQQFEYQRPELRLDPHRGQNTKADTHVNIDPQTLFEDNSTFEDQVEDDPGMNRPEEARGIVNDYVGLKEVKIEGRRIVDISYMLDQIHEKFDNHNPILNCSFRDVIQKKARRYGLQTQIFFECQVCEFQDSIWTDRNTDDTMTINRAVVAGTMAVGIGYSQLKELLASVSIPCMAERTYRSYDMEMVAAFEKAALAELLQSGERAKELAMNRGDFIVHEGKKIPYITVVADCAWMKRSYKTGKYDSLSGVATIIDQHTGKVIFIGVRNKFCFICEWAARNDATPKPHVCFKNWGRDQASTGMEADALLEGFQTSMEMHGLIYKTLVADGDSNVYKTILNNDPYGKYGVVVEKKECVNHLLRNLTRKIKTVASNTKGRSISQLKKLVGGSSLKFRKAIEDATAHRQKNAEGNCASQDQINLLRSDVLNTPYHVFGDHRKCTELNSFCVERTSDEGLNLVESLKKAGLFQQLEEAITYLAIHSDSLIYHATNNVVESFNSIVCKLIGGKRLNFGMRGSFQGRCAGSVLQYNTQNILTKLHESEGKRPPTTVTTLEAQRQRKVANNAKGREIRKLSRTRPEKTRKQQGHDNQYGPNAEKPDLPVYVYDDLLLLHQSRLLEQQRNRVEIETNTRGQADNGLWKSVRSKMLTASNFVRVCRMHDTTSCAATVKAILYPSVKSTPAMAWGRTNESKAIEALEEKLTEEGTGITIRPCGLFIDRDLEFFGASPDGVINDKCIVEVKCPKSAQNYHPEDALAQRVGEVHKYFDVKDPTEMNKSHHYYYQVQGQLHITQSDVCYFTVWTPLGLKYVKVPRDDQFWSQQMEPFLTRFYKHCLLPEIIDARQTRNMPIREPEYILKARQFKIQAAETSKAGGSRVRKGVIAVFDSAATSEKDDRGGAPGGDEIRRVAPLKLMRQNHEDSDSWTVTSADEQNSDSELAVASLKLVKRKAENGVYWSISSEDEQCSVRDKVRIPPLKLMKKRTQHGHLWVVSSADEQESDHQRQGLSAHSGARTPQNAPAKIDLTTAQVSKKRDNAPWVVVSDNDFTDSPDEIDIAVMEAVNNDIPIAEVRRDILSVTSLLNDTSIDQFLSVIKETTNFNTETSLWVVIPRFIKPSCTSQDIHIIGGNRFRHWRCTYFDGTQLFVYDSLGCKDYQLLQAEEKKFISLRYPNFDTKDIVFPVTQRQPDSYSCGVFAAAFATTVALGGNPSNEVYSRDVMKLRNHLIRIIESKKLSVFPSV